MRTCESDDQTGSKERYWGPDERIGPIDIKSHLLRISLRYRCQWLIGLQQTFALDFSFCSRNLRLSDHQEVELKIAFLGVRVPGHLNPMTTFARKMKARGHDVVFLSVLDTEPFVRAAQLPISPFLRRGFPSWIAGEIVGSVE